MTKLLVEMNAAVEALAMSLLPPELEAFAKRYDEVVKLGFAANPAPVASGQSEMKKRGRSNHHPMNLLIRLRDFKD